MEPPPLDSLEWTVVPPHSDPDKQEPIWVDVRFDIRRLGSIDTKNTCAFVKLRVYYYWTDPRLADWGQSKKWATAKRAVGVNRNGHFITRLPDLVWGPQFNLANSIGDMKVTQDEFTLIGRAEGRLRRVHVYEGRVDNDMDLTDFPFDIDDVTVQFTSQSRWSTMDGSFSGRAAGVQTYKVRRVCRPDEGHVVSLSMRTDSFEFKMHGISTSVTETPAVREGEVMTLIDVDFVVSRDHMYYMWKVMLPLVLLTFFSFQVFLFHPRALSQRASTSATYFLAIFAMLYTLGEGLPKTDFLTTVDKIIVLTIVSLGVGGVSSTLLYLYVNEGNLPVDNNVIIDMSKKPIGQRDETAAAVNQLVALSTIGTFVFANIVVFVPVVLRANSRKGELARNWYPRSAQAEQAHNADTLALQASYGGDSGASIRASSHNKPECIKDGCWFETLSHIKSLRDDDEMGDC